MDIGARVQRGIDWQAHRGVAERVARCADFGGFVHRKWGDQDGGPGKLGTIIGEGDGWAKVKWDAGQENQYRIGQDECYDLVYAEGEEPKKARARPAFRCEGCGRADRASPQAPSKRVRGQPVNWVDVGARVQRGKDW